MDRSLFDTNVLSHYLAARRNNAETPLTVLVEKYIHEYDTLEISVITQYEIRRGLLKKSATKQVEYFDPQ